MKELNSRTVESSEFVEQTFKFWFKDNEHIRSPFPNYIHRTLQHRATTTFWEWTKNLNPKAKDEVNDEIISEKFEEIIFETALELIQTEDERITIIYPFLPRKGDKLQGSDDRIITRSMIKEGDDSYLKVVLENSDTKKTWDTKFELPL